MKMVSVSSERGIWVISLDRPSRRNAVDLPTADALAAAFRDFDADESAQVAILTGAGGTFCAGADLKSFLEGKGEGNRLVAVREGDGPMGPTRLRLSKPVIAAIEGHAVAGGLELALWCDLRVAAEDATFGVFCRRWGVPLIDGGNVRLPRLIGISQALDLILTGRPVSAREALRMGLVNRCVPAGEALPQALKLAQQIQSFPQRCMRNDRMALLEGMERASETEALEVEWRHGMDSITETSKGVERFVQGEGRHGSFSFTDGPENSKDERSDGSNGAEKIEEEEEPPEAVVFDLGGVILDSPFEVVATVETQNGMPQGTLLGALAALARDDGPWAALERGAIPPDELARALEEQCAAHGFDSMDGEDLLRRIMQLPPRVDMLRAIRTVRAKGIKTAVLTNNFFWPDDPQQASVRVLPEPPDAPSVATLGLLEGCMDTIVESCRVGFRKPQREIYEVTRERLGVPHHKIAFLDDIGANLKTAKQLGWRTILVQRDYLQALGTLGRFVGIPLVRKAVGMATRGRGRR